MLRQFIQAKGSQDNGMQGAGGTVGGHATASLPDVGVALSTKVDGGDISRIVGISLLQTG